VAHWHEPFAINPVPVLLASGDKALVYFAQRDLISEQVGPVDILWRLPEASKLLRKQQADGSWRYPSRRKHGLPNENYDLLETYRALRILIEKYGFSNEHPAIQGAAGYLFSFQTEEGDIRGIFGSEFQFPFWWPNLLTALDSFSLMGYTRGDEDMQKGLQWFVANQGEDGLWQTSYKVSTPDKDRDARLWIALAVCHVFKRLYGWARPYRRGARWRSNSILHECAPLLNALADREEVAWQRLKAIVA